MLSACMPSDGNVGVCVGMLSKKNWQFGNKWFVTTPRHWSYSKSERTVYYKSALATHIQSCRCSGRIWETVATQKSSYSFRDLHTFSVYTYVHRYVTSPLVFLNAVAHETFHLSFSSGSVCNTVLLRIGT